MELDERLRTELHALAEQHPAELTDAQRARVRSVVLARVAKRRLSTGWLLVPAVACAIGLLLYARPATAPTARRELAPAQLPSVAQAAPACARAPREPFQFTAHGARDQLLELARARIVKDTKQAVQLASFDACELGLSLTSGELVVHARALQGGSLWIDTPLGRVQVRGTLFSVRAEAQQLRVAVVEGLVAVLRDEQTLAEVPTERVLTVDAQGNVRTEPLSARERAQLLARLQPARAQGSMRPAVVGAPAGEPEPKLEEHHWHEGALQGYSPEEREPASSVQPDGRPMKKPTLVP